MRILAVTNLYPNPYQPNRSTFNRQQFKAIAAECPIAVISPVAWTDELRAWPGRRSRTTNPLAVADNGITVEHPRFLFTPKIMRRWYGHFFLRSIRKSFERAVREFRPDAVLGSWAYPDGWAAGRLARDAGLPVVVKVHGSDVLMLAKSGARRRVTASALRQADGVIAVSRDLLNGVIGLGVDPNRVRLIYNGVDSNLFHPGDRLQARRELGIASDAKVLLYVGNLVPVKGLDVLLDACASLAPRHPGLACFIVGQGPLRSALERQSARLGINERVNFVGDWPHHELPTWFRAADVFVLPSVSEGVPNVLLEACACGTRFVATRVGGIPEIAALGDGKLVPASDCSALAGAIDQVLQSAPRVGPDDRSELRSHEAAASEVIRFLQEVRGARQALPARSITPSPEPRETAALAPLAS